MNSVSNKIKIALLSAASIIGLASIVSCASKPEIQALPDCNYAANISASEQIKTFIWRDKNHATFAQDWLQISLLEIAKRYQYLQRKSLTVED